MAGESFAAFRGVNLGTVSPAASGFLRAGFKANVRHIAQMIKRAEA